jgi:hypothetical protein
VPLSSSIRLLYTGATLSREAWSSPDSSLTISRLFLVLDMRDLRGLPSSMKASTTVSQRATKRAVNHRGNATWRNQHKRVTHPPLPPPASSQENENSSPPTSLQFNNTKVTQVMTGARRWSRFHASNGSGRFLSAGTQRMLVAIQRVIFSNWPGNKPSQVFGRGSLTSTPLVD